MAKTDAAVETRFMLAGYTTDGSEYFGEARASVGGSLHMAVSKDGGKTYVPLNYGVGVLYADADYSNEALDVLGGDTKILRDPYIFRAVSGFGVIAARAGAGGEPDKTDGSAAVYLSADLDKFELLGYIKLDSAEIHEPKCVYQNGEYIITWSNAPCGGRKKAVSRDLRSIGAVLKTDEVYSRPDIGIKNARAACALCISEKEYNDAAAKLNTPEHIGFETFEDITAAAEKTPNMPGLAAAVYSDGSVQKYPVIWDMPPADALSAGEYTVTGTVTAKDYPSDFMPDKADPCILRIDGKYYFTATRDNGKQDGLDIRVSDTLDGIAEAEEYELYSDGKNLIWAPELHNAGGRLMIFFALGDDWKTVRSHVMIFNGGEITDKDSWSEPVPITKSDGVTNLIDDGITLDMTCFEYGGRYYLAWSQRRIDCGNISVHESANIYIAEYDPSEPYRLAGEPAVISRPAMGWERTDAAVNEGPFVIKNNGRLYMTAAVNAVNSSYGIKLMTLKEGGNPLKAGDWNIKGRPLLCAAMERSEPGPGHSSFSADETGEPVLVYHWGTDGSRRTATVKNVHFGKDGEPVLNIPRGKQLTNDKVTVKVIIK